MTDELYARIRAADPAAGHGVSPTSPTSIRDLREQTMNSTDPNATGPNTTGPNTTGPSPTGGPDNESGHDRRRSPWLVAAAVVAVLSLAGAGVAGVLTRGDQDGLAGSKPSVVLALPDSNIANSCMQYSVDVLAGMPTAFSGTAVSVGDGTVLLRVDTWYRGGSGETVALRNPDRAMTSIEGVEFAEGSRYLVTASEMGTVNTCGFTGPWTADMAADFATAFGG